MTIHANCIEDASAGIMNTQNQKSWQRIFVGLGLLVFGWFWFHFMLAINTSTAFRTPRPEEYPLRDLSVWEALDKSDAFSIFIYVLPGATGFLLVVLGILGVLKSAEDGSK
jgi:hypothetical protein